MPGEGAEEMDRPAVPTSIHNCVAIEAGDVSSCELHNARLAKLILLWLISNHCCVCSSSPLAGSPGGDQAPGEGSGSIPVQQHAQDDR